MADSPSPILLLRFMSTGSQVNLWGGYNNTSMQTIERAAKGYETLPVTGNATIVWSNYSAANTGATARLKLTGALGAAAVLTFPGYQNFLSVENTAGAQVTIKCSGGTGVDIANGQRVLIYCDGVDYYNAAPTKFPTANITFAGQLKGVSTATDGTDAPNLTQTLALIAAGGIGGAAGTVKVDPTANPLYLLQALTAGTDIVIDDDGDSLGLNTVPYWNTPRVVSATPITALDRDILLVRTSLITSVVNLPADGRVKIVDIDGNAAVANITITPAGADTITFGTIDSNYFEGIYQRRPSGTNWDLT